MLGQSSVTAYIPISESHYYHYLIVEVDSLWADNHQIPQESFVPVEPPGYNQHFLKEMRILNNKARRPLHDQQEFYEW